MKTGRILERFKAKDGKEVTVRTPRWEDLDDLMELLNSLVDEGAMIGRNKRITREEEADWLAKLFVVLEKGEGYSLVAEADGRVVGTCGLKKKKSWWSHVGEVGVGIKEEYRGIGIGTAMLRRLLAQADEMDLRILVLKLFSTNKVAYHLYEGLGFKETGRIPKALFKDGEYLDEVTMTKELLDAES